MHHLLELLTFSYWIDIPWFRTDGRLATIFIKTFSWGSQLVGHLLHQLHANKFSGINHHRAINKFSGAVAGEEKEDFCKRSFAGTSFTLF
jgi:hypothetical protein